MHGIGIQFLPYCLLAESEMFAIRRIIFCILKLVIYVCYNPYQFFSLLGKWENVTDIMQRVIMMTFLVLISSTVFISIFCRTETPYVQKQPIMTRPCIKKLNEPKMGQTFVICNV